MPEFHHTRQAVLAVVGRAGVGLMGRSQRRWWRRLVAGGWLVGCAVLASGSGSAGLSRGEPGASGGVADTQVRVLQMNLCDSGLAGCYTGRSVTAAAAVIRDRAPDLVTLNEVCRDDMSILERALAGSGEVVGTASAFQPARDRRTGAPFRCRDGQPYGIGLVARPPAVARSGFTSTRSGIYPIQDTTDPEERAWLCVDADAFAACTTHLADTSAQVAWAQCRYLVGTAILAVRAGDSHAPAVLGGDLNLRVGGSPDVRSCPPAGDRRADDGGVQDIVVTPEFVIASRELINLQATTDHPGLLATLTLTLAPTPSSPTRAHTDAAAARNAGHIRAAASANSHPPAAGPPSAGRWPPPSRWWRRG
jgi:hypothetical protein